MPRLYREAPLELDLGGLGQRHRASTCCARWRSTPEALDAFFAEVERGRRRRPRLDAHVAALRGRVRRPRGDRGARAADRRADGAGAAGLAARAPRPPAVADAFCASRLARRRGRAFGTLPAGADFGRDRRAPHAASVARPRARRTWHHQGMPTGSSIQLVRLFGIRIGVSASWFIVLFLFIFLLSGSFRDVLGGSDRQAYTVAVIARCCSSSR